MKKDASRKQSEAMRRWWARLTPEERLEHGRKIQAARIAQVKRERSRLVFGLPQKTSLILVRDHKRAKQMSSYRSRLRKLGYIVERRSNIAYYDSRTTRHRLIEQRAHRYGITIKAIEDGQQ